MSLKVLKFTWPRSNLPGEILQQKLLNPVNSDEMKKPTYKENPFIRPWFSLLKFSKKNNYYRVR